MSLIIRFPLDIVQCALFGSNLILYCTGVNTVTRIECIQPNTPVSSTSNLDKIADEIDGFIIYLNVNGNHLPLSLDESNFNDLTDDLQRLMQNNVIPAFNIQTLWFSLDYKDFVEIGVVEANNNDKDKGGDNPERDPYEEQFSKISAIDDNLEHAVKIGVGRCIIMNKKKPATQNPDEANKLSTLSTSSSSSRASTPSTRPKRSLSNVLYEIAKEKQEGRNRRHQEKLQIMRGFAEKFLNKTE
ncbi:hypothetical protein FQR65_LT09761 [Abscondita terminalis]|nr:hypothetical protein FQR65_LT09761 [Abscondita terminalis]